MWLWLQCSAAAAAAKSLQSCLTLCDPRDSSLPGSPIPGILQVRTLEWVAISFSSAWKWKVKVKLLSHVWLLVTLWTADYQAPPPMGLSRQQYWSGVPLTYSKYRPAPGPLHFPFPLSLRYLQCLLLFFPFNLGSFAILLLRTSLTIWNLIASLLP